MPNGSPFAAHEINGIQVVTADGRKPSRYAATGFVEGDRIRRLKFIQALRSSGVGDIAELTKGIRTSGVIEPLVVRPAGNGKDFELIAGERRLEAAQKVGGKAWQHVPVIIRTDLDDDDKATAVAIAENSEDGRSNLNIIDIGRQAERFQEKGWTADRMAKEMGLHVRKVRRAIQLVSEVSPSVQEKVQAGELPMTAALELTQLPEDVREKIEDRLGPDTTASEIRRIRKKIEADAAKEKAEKGEDIESRRKRGGEAKTRQATAWKTPSEKKMQLGQMAMSLHGADGDEIGTYDYHELRGGLAALLWDRGDLESPFLPTIYEEEMENPAQEKKLNALFNEIVANEAARHEKRLAAGA
jgi:ParB/RepB/Spo0J family partition protein